MSDEYDLAIKLLLFQIDRAEYERRSARHRDREAWEDATAAARAYEVQGFIPTVDRDPRYLNAWPEWGA